MWHSGPSVGPSGCQGNYHGDIAGGFLSGRCDISGLVMMADSMSACELHYQWMVLSVLFAHSYLSNSLFLFPPTVLSLCFLSAHPSYFHVKNFPAYILRFYLMTFGSQICFSFCSCFLFDPVCFSIGRNNKFRYSLEP